MEEAVVSGFVEDLAEGGGEEMDDTGELRPQTREARQGVKLPRLRSGFRRAAQTPRRRLNFDSASRPLRERLAPLRMTE